MAMARQVSSFKVGGRIEPPYFLNRQKALQVLARDALTLSQSNVVMAPRRFGKTALLQTVQRSVADDLLAIYVNCLGVTGPVGFHDRLVEGMLAAYELRYGKARCLLATWRDLLKKPVLGMRDRLEEIGGSIKGVGTIRLKFRTREVDEESLLEAAFDFLEGFAIEQDENVLLILDEFQALARFDGHLFSLFKEKMESQRRVVYLFSGSSLRILREVFGREGESPLYQMVGRLFLNEIEGESVHAFFRDRLREVHGVTITNKALDRVTERVGGIPYYFQKLGLELERRILFEARKRIGETIVEEAFAQVLAELSSDFQERWETRFNDQQRAILKVLAAEPGSLTQTARSLGLPPENLTYNLNRLRDAMILSKEGRIYRITDRVFAAWLREL